MYDDILVPTDGGDDVDRVVDHALDIAKRRDARIHALYVVDTRSFITLDEGTVDDVVGELTEKGEAATDAVTQRATDAGLQTVSEVRRGNPAEVILDYLFETDVDLVVMGHHDEHDQRAMLGSVAKRIVSKSSVPVLTVQVTD
ncbi:universal stress protein [Halanaeroarchaeum sulfurireducens]|uniref:UspA domain-containing protein n=1 Tax=Halanaeroarchaeum sulfurireducens TaxID=1604004 RepID=A0A0F7PFZ5_9EURY|nr:universal stress protein [Halanaeroarchaeum sulfurireducens]AKH98203.1 UspA domain-containing protein [Halanaeroarchaeum sulfurireducens]ALG82597.1 UspA domain-containing protein [Halanaeroarchaeum sulfurireducens]